MKIEKITNDNFKTEVLQSEMSVLVDFYADWCGPCKMLAPIVDEIAQENDDIKVAKVNVDENPNIALDYKVMSIPTLVVIKGGKEVSRSVGVVDKKDIIDGRIIDWSKLSAEELKRMKKAYEERENKIRMKIDKELDLEENFESER